MNITIVEGPRTSWFTTLARTRGELGITDDSRDEQLSDLIGEVSDDIAEYTNRVWSRRSVTERQIGYGTTQQMLTVTPLMRVTDVRLHGASVSGWSVANAEAGFLFRLDRFTDTRAYEQWVTAELDARSQGQPAWEEDYIGGYLMPGDDITPSGTLSAQSSDSSFNLANVDELENRFPLLVSGEYIQVGGFGTSTNNGRFKVLDRTPDKLIVAGSLIDETPSGVTSIRCRTLPRNLEAMALLEIRSRFLGASRDPEIKSESIGDWSATYESSADSNERSFGGLTARVARGLDRYVRAE